MVAFVKNHGGKNRNFLGLLLFALGIRHLASAGKAIICGDGIDQKCVEAVSCSRERKLGCSESSYGPEVPE